MKDYHVRRNRRRFRRVKRAVMIVCIVILILGVIYFALRAREYARQEAVNSRIKETYYSGQTGNTAEPTATVEPTATAEPTATVEPTATATAEPTATVEPTATATAEPTATVEPEVTALPSEAEQDSAESVEGHAENESTAGNAGLPEDVTSTENENSVEGGEGTEDATNPEGESAVEEEPVVEEPVLQPEFVALYEENPDTVGWIKMADCVDYPIVWRDNTFYMDHGFDGKASSAGAIFLDARNQPDMLDSAMLIYGHNMKNGTMFGNLDRYRKADYLKKYPIITIQSAWESEPRKYVLISLFDASMNRSDRSYISIIHTSFEEPAEKEDFIAKMCARSMYKIGIETTADDQLLTLVTCSYTYNNGRFLLFARELREDETEEDIMAAFAEMKLK